jgi:molybdenum-dependent DNA-binding transcriptional regulator ModE
MEINTGSEKYYRRAEKIIRRINDIVYIQRITRRQGGGSAGVMNIL